jgi:nicotinamide riboside kinase
MVHGANNMLISFTGAQSSGKTTLLNHWNDCTNHWNVVPEVTRKLKRQGFDINDDSDNYTDTQIAILTDHLNNIFSYSNTDMNTILDRCLVDGFVYTRYFRMNGKVDEFTDKVFSYMLNKYISRYDYIFYTSPYDVALINDGERSISESFRNRIIKLYEELILNKYPNVFVLEGSVESRYNKMVEIISNGKTE